HLTVHPPTLTRKSAQDGEVDSTVPIEISGCQSTGRLVDLDEERRLKGTIAVPEQDRKVVCRRRMGYGKVGSAVPVEVRSYECKRVITHRSIDSGGKATLGSPEEN